MGYITALAASTGIAFAKPIRVLRLAPGPEAMRAQARRQPLASQAA
jgi:hypothetical protein